MSLLGIANHGVWTSDEPRVAGIGREMWRTGSWIVPRLTGRPFLEQPPLYYWAQAALFTLLQRSDVGVARLPSALFSLGNVAMCFALGRRFFSLRACFLAGMVLLTLYTFLQRSHWIVVDSALAFGITGALACFAHGEASLGARRYWCWAGMTACMIVAFLSKGTIGPGLSGVGIVTYLIWRGRVRELELPLAVSGALVGLVGAVWLWGVWLELGRAGVDEFLAQNQVSRFLPGVMNSLGYEVGHIRPIYYYVYHFPVQFLPWSPLVALALWDAWRHRAELSEGERAGLQLVVSFLASSFAVLSLAGTKRALYLLPLAAPLALLLGWWMQARIARARWRVWLEDGWGRAVLAVAVLLPAASLWLGAGAWPWLGACAVFAVLAWLAETDAAERELRWQRRLLITAASLSCFLISGLPAIDRYKSFVPMIQSLDGTLGPSAKLCALRPSETLRGLISFYTDRELCVIDEPRQLEAIAQGNADLWLVAEREFPDLRSIGVSCQHYATLRNDQWLLRMMRIRPPQTTAERAEPARAL